MADSLTGTYSIKGETLTDIADAIREAGETTSPIKVKNFATMISSLPATGTYTAGDNIQISSDKVISATDTTYTAGANITIEDGKISATDTTYEAATQTIGGLMSAVDKIKLDGIDEQANKYVLPAASADTLGGVKVGTNLSIGSDGKLNAVDTTYSAATTSSDGLMSISDKEKLDSVEIGANKYTLPVASADTLGGVKIGTNLTIEDGGKLNAKDTTYTAGPGITISDTNVISASGAGGIVTWADVSSKPFSSIGAGLTVVDEELRAISGSTSVAADWRAESGEVGYIQSRPFKVIGTGLEVVDNSLNFKGVDWNAETTAEKGITNRPFKTIGTGLQVSDNVLSAKGADWSAEPTSDSGIKNRPFSSIGSGLEKDANDILNVKRISWTADTSSDTGIADRPFLNVGSGLTVDESTKALKTKGVDWTAATTAEDGIKNRPFNSIGHNLSVDSDVLKAVDSDWNAEEGEDGFIENKPTIPVIQWSTTDLTDGVSPLTTGTLYLVY